MLDSASAPASLVLIASASTFGLAFVPAIAKFS